MSSATAIDLSALDKVYETGAAKVHALRGIDLHVDAGELIAIVGPSGSGKTTFMEILGCLSRPTGGTYRLGGRDVSALEADALARLRGETIGFVFQSFNLLPRLSATENVELPLGYRGVPRRERRARARRALERVGLAHRTEHTPNQMSGGERQRVAVARALVGEPSLVLADEPTGNLDSATGEGILALLHGIHAGGATVVVVTHDAEVAARAPRRVSLRDGRVERDERDPGSGGA